MIKKYFVALLKLEMQIYRATNFRLVGTLLKTYLQNILCQFCGENKTESTLLVQIFDYADN